jgi:NADPH-dependent 2,4-dienoyl-CoA reductase/sulfur reductase-like enzyme
LVDDVDRLIVRTPEVFREKQDIDARVLHEVVEIDLRKRRIQVRPLTGQKAEGVSFDLLMIATGAMPLCPDVQGSDAHGIYGISTLASGLDVYRMIEKEEPKRAVVVGGGYIGLEMAEALIRRGLEVSLVERSREVMGTLDPDMGSLVSKALMDVGVKLYREESLEGFEVTKGRVRGVVTDRQTLAADIVILGMGVRPNTMLAEEAGIPVGVKRAIQVDRRMQTKVEGVWAAGDCVESLHLVSGKPFYIALGTVANKQGRVAGMNIGGEEATFPGVLGTAVSKICDVEVARTGLQESEIKPLGIPYAVGKVESSTRAGYYPGAGRITIKVLGERGTGRFLGGQIVGIEGAAKRIDVMAAALHARMNVQEMAYMDLSYAPPYSPVWDPVLIAARKAAERV